MECVLVRILNEIKDGLVFFVCCCANDAYGFVQFNVEALKRGLDGCVFAADFIEP